MKITIYNAISLDGFIARENNDTDWVSDTDWEIFNKKVKELKAIVMGKNTYIQSGEDYPYNCELNIVMTHDKGLIKEGNAKQGQLFTDMTPLQVAEYVENEGFSNLLVIGGGKLNASFLKAGLVDEVIVDIHPIILGAGIKQFEDEDLTKRIERISIQEHEEGLVEISYKMIK